MCFCQYSESCHRPTRRSRRSGNPGVLANRRGMEYADSAMKRQLSRYLLLLSVMAPTLIAARAQTNTLLVPSEVENTFGNSDADPFFNIHTSIEQIYPPSHFAVASADLITITEVAFRADESWDGIFDAVIGRVQLQMNVFRGPMADMVRNQSGVEAPVTTVFDRENVRVSGRAGELDSFTVRFPLQTPFNYDRRAGQLVLAIHTSGTDAGDLFSVDAQANSSHERGVYILLEPLGQRRVRSQALATEFSYTAISAAIDGVRRRTNTIEIDFSTRGNPRGIWIEGSATANGIYNYDPSAQMVALGPDKMRAIIPMTSKDRFFRVRLDIP